mgnify:FL=1
MVHNSENPDQWTTLLLRSKSEKKICFWHILYDFTDNYVESRLQEIQTMLRSQTEEKHQFLVIHHSLTVGMNAHISKSVEMKVLEKTISSIKFWGGGEAQVTE